MKLKIMRHTENPRVRGSGLIGRRPLLKKSSWSKRLLYWKHAWKSTSLDARSHRFHAYDDANVPPIPQSHILLSVRTVSGEKGRIVVPREDNLI